MTNYSESLYSLWFINTESIIIWTVSYNIKYSLTDSILDIWYYLTHENNRSLNAIYWIVKINVRQENHSVVSSCSSISSDWLLSELVPGISSTASFVFVGTVWALSDFGWYLLRVRHIRYEAWTVTYRPIGAPKLIIKGRSPKIWPS